MAIALGIHLVHPGNLMWVKIDPRYVFVPEVMIPSVEPDFSLYSFPEIPRYILAEFDSH